MYQAAYCTLTIHLSWIRANKNQLKKPEEPKDSRHNKKGNSNEVNKAVRIS